MVWLTLWIKDTSLKTACQDKERNRKIKWPERRSAQMQADSISKSYSLLPRGWRVAQGRCVWRTAQTVAAI